MPARSKQGGRVAVGLLPKFVALPLARLEPYGMIILIAALLILPVLGAQMSVDLNILPHLITGPVETIIRAIVWLTSNG
jgi:hypothetical protein